MTIAAEFVDSAHVDQEVIKTDAVELKAIDDAVDLLRSLRWENWAIMTSAGRELAGRCPA